METRKVNYTDPNTQLEALNETAETIIERLKNPIDISTLCSLTEALVNVFGLMNTITPNKEGKGGVYLPMKSTNTE